MKSLAFKLDFNEYYKYKDASYFNNDKGRNYGEFMNGRGNGNGGGSHGGMDIED
jgi:hypothetical protein